MRLKLDENLPIELKRLMATSGHDAETVLDEGMGGKTDADVLTVCLAENRVLMTQDLDFSDIRAFSSIGIPWHHCLPASQPGSRWASGGLRCLGEDAG